MWDGKKRGKEMDPVTFGVESFMHLSVLGFKPFFAFFRCPAKFAILARTWCISTAVLS